MAELKLVNLTAHDIVLLTDEGGEYIIEPSGIVARVANKETRRVRLRLPDGQHIAGRRFDGGSIVNLPEPADGVILFVSRAVATHRDALGRQDIICPGDQVVEGGRVIGARILDKYGEAR